MLQLEATVKEAKEGQDFHPGCSLSLEMCTGVAICRCFLPGCSGQSDNGAEGAAVKSIQSP